MTTSRRVHRTGTRILSAAMVVIGLILIIQGLVGEAGGGLVARVIIGALFTAAGLGRLWVLARQQATRESRRS
jgi:hypothetical protein